MKLDLLIDAFLEDACAGKSNETPAAYRSKLRHLQRYLGADREEISQSEIDQFKRYLLNRKTKIRGGKEVDGALSKFTIRTILQTTCHFIKWAHEKGFYPSLQLKNIKEPEADPKAIDPRTVDSLLAAAAKHGPEWEQARNIAILHVLRDTGGRVGSISKLDIDSIDDGLGIAFVPDKGDKVSTLRFSPATLEAIREWTRYRDELAPVDYALFIGDEGKRLKRLGIARVLDRLAKAERIPGRHNPHSFRHAFARDAILAGADLSQVSQLLNHAGVAVTQKFYLRWSKNELRRFHNKYSPGRLLPRPGKGTAKP